MRVFITTFLFAVALCSGLQLQINFDASLDPYILEDFINETIEGLRPDIPDPLQIDVLEIDLPDEPDAVLKGNGSITNFTLTGLQGFEITALSFDIGEAEPTLNFTLLFLVLDLFTEYTLDLNLADTLFIYSDGGNVTFHADEAQIQGSAPLNLTGGIQLDNTRIDLTLGNATFEIHGLLNDEDFSQLLSSILNDLAVNLIDENQELVTQILSPIVEGIINSIIAGLLAPTTTGPPDTTVPLN